jgi:DNA-binding transcriptional regulator YiaG
MVTPSRLLPRNRAVELRHNRRMPNIASVLKDEISRLSSKKVREETQGLKKAITAYRSEIAALKKRMQALEQQVRRLRKVTSKVAPAQKEKSPEKIRFSAKGLAKQRQRLGLSAQACGALIGASALSVYKWEKGEVRPRAKHLPAIASLRSMGKKEAAARLGQLAA